MPTGTNISIPGKCRQDQQSGQDVAAAARKEAGNEGSGKRMGAEDAERCPMSKQCRSQTE